MRTLECLFTMLLITSHLSIGEGILLSGSSTEDQGWRGHITYTWNRKLIKHVVNDPVQIKVAEIIDGAWTSGQINE
jgi:hypothetical protein